MKESCFYYAAILKSGIKVFKGNYYWDGDEHDKSEAFNDATEIPFFHILCDLHDIPEQNKDTISFRSELLKTNHSLSVAYLRTSPDGCLAATARGVLLCGALLVEPCETISDLLESLESLIFLDKELSQKAKFICEQLSILIGF